MFKKITHKSGWSILIIVIVLYTEDIEMNFKKDWGPFKIIFYMKVKQCRTHNIN